MGNQYDICWTIKNKYGKNKVKRPEEIWPNDIIRALKCLNDNLFVHNFTIAGMREACKIPQKNFSSRFKCYVGHTPASYLKYHRIQCSKELIDLIEIDISMSNLAFEIGYEYPSTFCCAFKDIVGYSPKKYLKFSKKKYKILLKNVSPMSN